MNIKYNLKEIHPNIWLVSMENTYDLAMTFCRVQEFYESPFKEIRGKHFDMTEFQRLYSMRLGEGLFTYPHDWAGFNVPSNVFWECYNGFETPMTDWSFYDSTILDINLQIDPKRNKKYYLIGSQTDNTCTISHEVAHALYYLNPKYKKAADKITDKIPKKVQKKFKKWLLSIGYNDKVFKDELQAYLSADYGNIIHEGEAFDEDSKLLDKLNKKMEKLNNDYTNRKN